MLNAMDGLILAGGKSRRMGQHKALLQVQGETLLMHHIHLMQPVVGKLFVACNDVPLQSLPGNVIFVGDYLAGHEGPLSGLMQVMLESTAEFIWLMGCDNYGFSAELKMVLHEAVEKNGADIAYVTHDGDAHPLLAVIRTRLKDSLQDFLQQDGRSVLKWYSLQNTVTVEFTNRCCFYNINTLEDYDELITSLCHPE